MRTIFWGTPELSIPFLELLCGQGDVAGVVTQTDKPSKRGQHLQKSPVKLFAEKADIPVLQPSSLKNEEFLTRLAALKPELGVVVAYGKIISKEAIRLFPAGLYNIHFSLLPKLRGGAPIQWAIYRGETTTGVTSFRISETLDTGHIVLQKEIAVSVHDNSITLEEKLIPLGIVTLQDTLKLINTGQVRERPQSGEATFAPLIKKEDTRINWNRPAEEIARQVRAFICPGAFCRLPDGKLLKILRAEPSASASSADPMDQSLSLDPGSICAVEHNRGFLVKCALGTLSVIKVQLEGKKETDAWSFLQGHKLQIGDRLQ